ncbi:MAG: hypothetical protein O6928_02290 [Gammaproteobacteria bacterium]|nr:hypothetical protein [Gammaproteobacteria bacterium]
MFSYFKKKKGSLRTLNNPGELKIGDIVVLKERRSLPPELQGQQLEVTHVGTYQYSSSIEKEFTLRSADSTSYYMSVDDNDGDPILCFTNKIPRESVLEIFNEDEFAQLWEPEFINLKVRSKPEQYTSWLTDNYHQIIKDEEGYYYNHDCTDKPPSQRIDDDGEELRYHECEGAPDNNRSLIVEVFGNGETNVFLEVSTPLDVIDELWPNADK